jgi:hypothetical protein
LVIKTAAKKAIQATLRKRRLRRAQKASNAARVQAAKDLAMLKDLKTKLHAHKTSMDKLKAQQAVLEVKKRNMERARLLKEVKWMKSYKKKTGSWPEDKWYKEISKKKWRV